VWREQILSPLSRSSYRTFSVRTLIIKWQWIHCSIKCRECTAFDGAMGLETLKADHPTSRSNNTNELIHVVMACGEVACGRGGTKKEDMIREKCTRLPYSVLYT
jgi:hypothetical protein